MVYPVKNKSMDGLDLFRKLGVGAKFDFKRFRKDAENLRLVRHQDTETPSVGGKRKTTESDFHLSKKFKVDDSPDTIETTSDDETYIDDTDDSSDDDKDDEGEKEEEENDNIIDEDEDESSELTLLGNITSKKKDSTLGAQKKPRVKTAEKLAAMKQEEINHVRKQNHIHFQGTDVPEPLTSFHQLKTRYDVSDTILQNITTVGYKTPTPIQIQAIPTMLERREIMACAPTGSGKTAAFIIPVLHHLKGPRKDGFRALVLAPTRELAKQIKREFQRLSEGMGFRIMFIENASTAAKKLSSKSGKRVDILVSTPNRVVYMLRENPPVIDLTNIQWLVIDESDKLFEEGKTGFREQLAEIYRACQNKDVRRAMFSATFAFDVEQWCKLNLDNVVHIYIGARNSATQTIEQELLFVGQESGKLLAVRDMVRKGVEAPVLVFVQSKDRAKELYQELAYDGMNVDIIHSDRSQEERDAVVKNFRAGRVWILICTELMGRGIDFKGVNLVINFDFPTSAISYIHRIGRTGRAGRRGRAITFFTEKDSKNLRSIANLMVEAGCPVPDYMLKMKRPSKKVRKKMEKHVPRRTSISTALHNHKQDRHIRKSPSKVESNKSNNSKRHNGRNEKLTKPKQQRLGSSKRTKKTKSGDVGSGKKNQLHKQKGSAKR